MTQQPKIMLVAVVAGAVLIRAVLLIVRNHRRRRLVRMARQRLDDSQPVCHVPHPCPAPPFADDIPKLVASLRSGQITAEAVLAAYQTAAVAAHEQTNCATEFVTTSTELARSLDKELSEHKMPRMLQGLPVSIKDCLEVATTSSTIGLLQRCGQVDHTDSVLVQVLKHHGCIPFIKTNIPQTMLTYDCSNPVFGATRNPYCPERTPGGSSGGEAALLALNGSAFGIGTDIGGSGRTPSIFCGGVGFKMTTGRVSIRGIYSSSLGQSGVFAGPAVMARNVAAVELGLRACLSPVMYELDKTLTPLPFNDDLFKSKKKLRIGYYVNDGYFKAVPGCERAVRETVTLIETKLSESFEIVPFQVPDIMLAMSLYFKLMSADSGENVMRILKNEPIDPTYRRMYMTVTMPRLVNWLLRGVFKYIFPSPRILQAMQASYHKSVATLWSLQAERERYRRALQEAMDKAGIDVLLMPGSAMPALPIGVPSDVFAALSYPMLFNLVNFPAGVMSTTHINKEDLELLESYPDGELDDMWYHTVKKACRNTEGLPVGVQVAAPPFRDEMALRVMSAIEDARR